MLGRERCAHLRAPELPAWNLPLGVDSIYPNRLNSPLATALPHSSPQKSLASARLHLQPQIGPKIMKTIWPEKSQNKVARNHGTKSASTLCKRGDDAATS